MFCTSYINVLLKSIEIKENLGKILEKSNILSTHKTKV